MLNNHKCDFRNSCLKKLEFESRFLKFYKDKNIVKKIERFIKVYKPNSVLLYVPMKMEVDVLPLINSLRKKQIEVFVPFMEGESFKAVLYRLPLHRKKYGIKEPNNSFKKPKKIDLAIVPVVGIDKEFKRIGFGKGMYDRFYDSLDYKPFTIFTQLKLCKSNKKLSNKYDIKADLIIT